MGIPESQLDTWSHQGSVPQSKSTYATIKGTLEDSQAPYAGKSFEIFLQGSYANDTNIYAESDVDVVIRLDEIMRSDISALPVEQQQAYRSTFGTATYTFAEFKDAVTRHLTNTYPLAVSGGNKSVKIKAGGSRRNADVVVCFQYRRYFRFIGVNDQTYVPGIIIPSLYSGEIINYPQRHSENCTAKHQATGGYFKPMARILKNARSRLVEDGKISADVAPSYFVEGLLYNVPAAKFGTNYRDTFVNCMNWLNSADKTKLVCANEQYYLVGDGKVQWPTAKYDQFFNALVDLWNNW